MMVPDGLSVGNYLFCDEKERALILVQRQSSKWENSCRPRVFSLVLTGSPDDPKPITGVGE